MNFLTYAGQKVVKMAHLWARKLQLPPEMRSFALVTPIFNVVKESGPKRNAKFSSGPLLQCFFASINFLTLIQIFRY